MRWAEMEERQPRLAALGRGRLLDPGVLLVATIRADGTPRLSPVEPYVLDGDLMLSMMWNSLKARDLMRDPRVLVHSIITNRDGAEGEFKVRGTALPVEEAATHREYAVAVHAALGWEPEVGRFHLFRVDVEQVAAIRYDAPTGDQHVTCWPPAREFVRKATSATSVGPPQPVSDLLTAG
jgi:hypothetical protein